jgi:uncharacterized repeat protein (TIGR03803 family)
MTRTEQSFATRLREVSIPLALTIAALMTAAAQAGTPGAAQPAAVTFNTLYSFTGGADGGSPFSAVVEDTTGNLYGTTALGGASNCGAVYEIMPMSMMGMEMWMYMPVYSFTCGADGANPYAGLLIDASGNLYGTTASGGAGTCHIDNMGCGVVYELMPMTMDGMNETWMYMGLHTFSGTAGDGATPFTGLFMGPDGVLYGTSYGGSFGAGTVFATNGTSEKVVFNFKASTDGAYPLTGLVAGQNGTFYGTTSSGGANGGGTFFSIESDGTPMKTLHSFGGSGDGATPIFGSLAQDTMGNLYGTTARGGAHNCGTVYEMMPMAMGGTPTWMYMPLYSFTCGADGGHPTGSLHIDKTGNIFGTTSCKDCGGSAGTIFKLSPGGALTTLHRFTGGADGGFPLGGLKGSPTGALYGSTNSGGSGGAGTVWSLVP